MADEEQQTTIVSAVGTAGGSAKELSEGVQQAMVWAIERAMAEGVTDPDEIRQRQLDARDKAVAAMREASDQAIAAGITDPEDINRLMLAARDKALG
jgi:hypothetical protein